MRKSATVLLMMLADALFFASFIGFFYWPILRKVEEYLGATGTLIVADAGLGAFYGNLIWIAALYGLLLASLYVIYSIFAVFTWILARRFWKRKATWRKIVRLNIAWVLLLFAIRFIYAVVRLPFAVSGYGVSLVDIIFGLATGFLIYGSLWSYRTGKVRSGLSTAISHWRLFLLIITAYIALDLVLKALSHLPAPIYTPLSIIMVLAGISAVRIRIAGDRS